MALITTDIIYLKNCSGEKIGGIKYGPFGSNWSEKREGNNTSRKVKPRSSKTKNREASPKGMLE